MSKKVDDRVVEMRFDNSQFEANVKTSMGTLDRLKNALKLPNASAGIQEVSKTASKVDLSGLTKGLETANVKFSSLQVVAMTALSNITSAALKAGASIATALTVQPIFDGFREYETQINAVQTILANTKSKGGTLEQVNKSLDELNTYADKTIYNFGEMTKNIGTFTAAGVGLETSVTSIKGIANLAAMSGSTSAQAASAMYQLSQAIAAGKVQLMDWNSVVNAGMGGEVFQNALKRTATAMGTNVDAMIEKYGSFRESLTRGQWLTADVLTETLTQLSGAYTEADLIAQGYTEQQAKEIVELADTASKAATEVKTFTGLIGTVQEALGSGWAQTWEIIVGDFAEAKGLFTDISNTLGAMVEQSATSRNELLQGWKDLGGRDMLVESLNNSFEALLSIVKPIKEAFSDIFPPITAERLVGLTESLKNFTSGLKLSDEASANLKSTFKGLFAVLDIVRMAFSTVFDAIGSALGVTTKLGGGFLSLTAGIGEFLVGIRDTVKESGAFVAIGKVITGAFDGIGNVIEGVIGKVSSFGDFFSSIGEIVSNVASKIANGIKSVFTWISENITGGDIFAGLAGGGIFMLARKLSDVFSTIKDAIDGFLGGGDDDSGGGGIKEKITEVLDGVHSSLESFTSGIKATALLEIAAAIGILAHSLRTISEIEEADISNSLSAIGGMMIMLNLSFAAMAKTLITFPAKSLISAGVALIAIAKALDIFADAMLKISGLSIEEVATGLIGLGVGLLELSVALKIIDKAKIPISTIAAVLALAEACKILADALASFSSLSWEEIGRGLTGMGGALAELVASIAILSKVGGAGSIFGAASVLIAVQGLDEIASSLERLGNLSWEQIERGLDAMGGALIELVTSIAVLSKVGGSASVLGAASVLIAVQGLDEIAEALESMGSMSWDEIGRGLTAMGGALLEVSGITAAAGKLAGLGAVIGSGSLLLAVQGLDELASALQDFGSMSWEEIGRGLTAMGLALLEVSGITGAVGKIAGLGAVIGSGSLLLAVQGLDELASALQDFGSMSWEEIGRGLTAMGLALTEATGIPAIVGSLAPLGQAIGSGSLLLAVQGLDDLANALQKFGSMSWDEIGRGLTAMGAALGETALGGVLNTFSGIGAGAIAEMAEPLGLLADSVKKWVDVTVPDGFSGQLESLARGVKEFTLAGFGADALATVVEPLGALADSVAKWTNVTVPEGLGEQLSSLAPGIKEFNFAGWGADSISALATPLGTLAESVAKWANVTVPEGLGEQLSSLAPGIGAFNFAGWGADSIAALATPLGTLADSVGKWANVTVPENMETNLTNLATGVKAFQFSGWSADDITEIAEPLGTLADSIALWSGVTIPEDLGTNLEGLAKGLKEFNLGLFEDFDVADAIDPLNQLADVLPRFSGLAIATDIGTSITSLGDGLKHVSDLDVTNVETAAAGIKNLGDSVTAISGIDFAGIATQLTSFATSIDSIEISSESFSELGSSMITGFVEAINTGQDQVKTAVQSLASSATNALSSAVSQTSSSMTGVGRSLVSGLASGMQSGSGLIRSSINSIMSSALSSIRSKSSSFQSAGKLLSSAVAAGIRSGSSSVNGAVSSLVSSAGNRLRSQYGAFRSAGSYVASGFAAGIRSQISSAASAAASMASAASAAARANLKIKSPSRVFKEIGSRVPEGFAIGISTLSGSVKSAVRTMGDNAVDGAKLALSQMNTVLDSDIDINPTIRPVLDLTDIKSNAKSINGMLATKVPLSVIGNANRINRMMNARNQNGGFDDVVSAIDKLRKNIGDIGSNTYNINGITYDDGSNVAQAIETLTRAIRIERRI